MHLAWLTDIHLNFLMPEELQEFYSELARVDADAWLISGDIGEAPTVGELLIDLHRASMFAALTLSRRTS